MKKSYFVILSLVLSVSALWGQGSSVVLLHVKKDPQPKNSTANYQAKVENEDLDAVEFVPLYTPTQKSEKPQKTKLKLSAPLSVKDVNQKTDMRKKAYLKQLLSVSPRVSYGVSFERAYMSYQVPMIDQYLKDGLDAVIDQFPWIRSDKVTLKPSDPNREREMIKRGRMTAVAGLNLPVIFVDVEAGAGRFGESLITFKDVIPPWKLFNSNSAREMLLDKVSGAGSQTAVSLKAGLELERILPDRWKPELNYGNVKMGLGGTFYFLASYDESYRVGAEIIAPDTRQQLVNLFEPFSFIPQNAKDDAVDKIINHVETSLPAYFWIPVMRGIGYSGKAYLDLGSRLRISARYHRERTRGLQPTNVEWLLSGPAVKRSFFAISIETQI
ncbi:MAG: hypothetical protein R3B93_26005 [Bacteroidia bacterium]